MVECVRLSNHLFIGTPQVPIVVFLLSIRINQDLFIRGRVDVD